MNPSLKQQISRFMPLAIIITVSGILSFWVSDFVGEVIVRPLLVMLWYASLILRSFPDTFFWILFILIFTVMAIRSLTGGLPRERQSRQETMVLGGPVSTWSRLVHHSNEGGYSQWQLSQSLSKLTWNLLQDERNKSMRRIEDGLRTQELDLPPDIQAYFEAGLLPYQPISTMKRRLGLEGATPALSLDPDRVVTHIEEKIDPLRSTNNTVSGDPE
ncbi:MAG: hypothetical protein AAF629_37630 [Chloroflexota bacterium]